MGRLRRSMLKNHSTSYDLNMSPGRLLTSCLDTIAITNRYFAASSTEIEGMGQSLVGLDSIASLCQPEARWWCWIELVRNFEMAERGTNFH